MAEKEGSTLAIEGTVAAVDERLEEALAVLGGVEIFDGEDDGAVIQTIIRIVRVSTQKLLEAQRTLKALDPGGA